ncbi:protein WVD2-like 7 isoform X2 [Asparagus officinalis]|uniref:protein WVD2-like 7 isoform X2 n=1 Tax=Asparagus officinalis TaxID=4686 RepID=UPI00098E2875|nr:protein WVD2-like 7 isoform X2 [Asparagus officinalis]
MGDSSFLVQGSCHSPEICKRDPDKDSTITAALGGSISFGRFLSESLDWGKWSSFCQKMHLEEIEKYSTPGSVAQKKAYFEAHYKKSAALKKSASLLEQSNAIVRAGRIDECNEEVSGMKLESEELSTEVARNEMNVKEPDLGEEQCGLETDHLQKTTVPVTEDKVTIEPSCDDIENHNRVIDHMQLRTSPPSKQPLNESSIVNQKDGDSIQKKQRVPMSKQKAVHRSPRLPPSLAPAESTSNSKKDETKSNEKMKSTLPSVHTSINFFQGRKGVPPIKNKTLPVTKKVEESKASSTLLKVIRGSTNHLATPTKASVNGTLNTASITSKPEDSEHRREKTPLHQRLSGRGKGEAKSYKGSVNFSGSSGIKESRLQAQTARPSLSLRSAERADKRKELSRNTEDNFCGKETEKLQLQKLPKEKAESDIKKLHQRHCFKARPLPAFYHSAEPPKIEIKKD